jgi:hypothetical protein
MLSLVQAAARLTLPLNEPTQIWLVGTNLSLMTVAFMFLAVGYNSVLVPTFSSRAPRAHQLPARFRRIG